jgi:hypothetical protein
LSVSILQDFLSLTQQGLASPVVDNSELINI